MPTATVRKTPLIILAALVMLTAAAVGGCFGWLAGRTNTIDQPWFGLTFGGISGLVATYFWCHILLRIVLRSYRPHRSLISSGAKWGMIAGMLAAFVVYCWLVLTWMAGHDFNIGSRLPLAFFLAAVTTGAGVGLLAGLFCGWLCWLAAMAAMSPKRKPRR